MILKTLLANPLHFLPRLKDTSNIRVLVSHDFEFDGYRIVSIRPTFNAKDRMYTCKKCGYVLNIPKEWLDKRNGHHRLSLRPTRISPQPKCDEYLMENALK